MQCQCWTAFIHCLTLSIADFGHINAGSDKPSTQKRYVLGNIISLVVWVNENTRRHNNCLD